MKTRLGVLLVALIAVVMLGGCATANGRPANPKDPLEPFNRSMFNLNDGLDHVIFNPITKTYTFVFPEFVRTGVSNFFSNIGDVWVGVNNLLQGKPGQATSDVGRVLVNSTIGVLGLFDVASDMGLKAHNEDFGQTLGVWGFGPGAYLVLPVLGPRNVRDSFGLAADIYTNPVGFISYVPTRNTMEGVQFIDIKANLSTATNLLDTAALDRYTFVRESYMQRRRNLVYDGDPPPLPPAKDEDEHVAPAPDKPATPAADKKSDAGADSAVAVAGAKTQPQPGNGAGNAARNVAYPLPVAALPDVIIVQPAEQVASSAGSELAAQPKP
jgi:phospholipid-binding lipoprotein MlaA